MDLAKTRTDREYLKFDLNSNLEHAVRTLPDIELMGDGIDASQLVKISPAFYHVSAILADTEYSQLLSANTKAIWVKANKICELKIYFSPSSVTYVTIPRGGYYHRENLKLNSVTIYFKSSVPSNLIEVEEWT